MGNLLGSLDIGESRIDEVCFSIVFDLENRTNQSLDHGFVINEASATLSRGLVEAALHSGLVERLTWVHLKYYREPVSMQCIKRKK